MAVVSKLLSISSPSPQFRKPRSSFNFNPVTSASPFTEKHSIERYRRESTWLLSTNQLNRPVSFPPDSDPSSIRERDIALQLPELKRLLEVLREKRESGGGGGGGERCRVWAWFIYQMNLNVRLRSSSLNRQIKLEQSIYLVKPRTVRERLGSFAALIVIL